MNVRKPIRVAYIMGSLRFGGAERHLTHLLSGLDRDAFDPRLFLSKREGHFLEEVERLGVPVEESGVRSVFTPEGFRGVRRLAARLRRDQIDVVHSYLYGANLIGMGIAAVVPRIVHLIGIRQQILPHPRVFRALFGIAAGPRTQFVSVSRAADGILGDWGIDSRWRHRVANGVDVPELASEQVREEVREEVRNELGVPPESPLVTMVANFHAVKGHRELIEAARTLLAEGLDLRLVLPGDGLLLEERRRQASEAGIDDRVLFLGQRSDIGRILQASDVFVLNSSSEGMSNALLEALAAGLPCVATDVGGNPELVESGINGFLVPPRDTVPLAQALRSLIRDGSLRRGMGEASRERAVREFSIEAMVEKTESIYRTVTRSEA